MTHLFNSLCVAGIIVLFSCQQSSTTSSLPLDTKEEILSRIQAPTFPDTVFSVIDFGAIADSISDNKPAFDLAIAACKRANGGKVVVPAGDYFIEGPIHLESNLNLVLNKGATLRFSSNPDAYPQVLTSWEGTMVYNYSPFIYCFQKENVAITGEGTIDGEASESWAKWHGLQKPDQLLTREMNHMGTPIEERQFGKAHFLRPQLIQFYDCKNILIEDIRIEDSPFWCVHILKCENVVLKGLIYDAQNKNNDGIDLEYSRDVLIENITFNNNDDNIAIKAGRDHEGRAMKLPTENVVVRNCHFKGLHAVVIGSEMSAGVRNIFVDNCDAAGYVKRGIYLKSNPDRGGMISDIFVNNVAFGELLDCFMITSNYHNEGSEFPTVIDNIHISNVSCEKANKYAIYIKGLEHQKITNVHLQNFKVDSASRGVFVDFSEQINFENVMINGAEVSWDPEVLKQNAISEWDY
jgi:polygalacturonase